jgi:hypothetical protein
MYVSAQVMLLATSILAEKINTSGNNLQTFMWFKIENNIEYYQNNLRK